jgi:hypothetical protein
MSMRFTIYDLRLTRRLVWLLAIAYCLSSAALPVPTTPPIPHPVTPLKLAKKTPPAAKPVKGTPTGAAMAVAAPAIVAVPVTNITITATTPMHYIWQESTNLTAWTPVQTNAFPPLTVQFPRQPGNHFFRVITEPNILPAKLAP